MTRIQEIESISRTLSLFKTLIFIKSTYLSISKLANTLTTYNFFVVLTLQYEWQVSSGRLRDNLKYHHTNTSYVQIEFKILIYLFLPTS